MLDPAAYDVPQSGPAEPLNPHRVWLFWSSTRNTYNWRGLYNGGTAYNVNDYVATGGTVGQPAAPYYVAKINNPTDAPSDTSPQWAPYFGGNDLYWEALNPRFEISYP